MDSPTPAASTRPPRSAVPTGPWGRPARLPATIAAPESDLPEAGGPAREGTGCDGSTGPEQLESRPGRSVGRPFRPTPPPPLPPGGLPTPGSRRDRTPPAPWWRRGIPLVQGRADGWARTVAELVAGLVILAVLAVAWNPQAPRPLGADAAWAQRADPAVAALAEDISRASTQPAMAPTTRRRLQADLRRAEAVGTPPDGRRERMWTLALGHIRSALQAEPTDPEGARNALVLAGLELADLSPGGAAVAQPQASGTAGPKAGGPS